jgi:hypothetical protein
MYVVPAAILLSAVDVLRCDEIDAGFVERDRGGMAEA